MNKTIFIFLLFIVKFSICQTQSYKNIKYNNAIFDFIKIKIDSSLAGKIEIIENKTKIPHNSILKAINSDSSKLILNAYPVDSANNPIGLLIKNKLTLHDINLNEGKGNFFLKPNGVLYINGSGAKIVDSKLYKPSSDIIWALQLGPALILNGELNSNFNKGSTNKNIRLAVGIINEQNADFLIYIISRNPVNFYDLSLFLKEQLNCNNALLIESAGCDMSFPFEELNLRKDKLHINNYLILKP
jgi:uncharacterized protein YigE (DUF2233 family)